MKPQPDDLSRVESGLVRIGACTGPSDQEPVTYQACQLPAKPSGPYTAGDWTAVVNQLLVENFYATEVLDYLSDLGTMQQSLFLDESSALPAIGDDLGLQAAAGGTGQFDMSLVSGGLGIAASIAGVFPGGGEASAALWIGSEVASMIPQSSPTATGPQFQSTYAGLKAQFAQMVGEVNTGMDAQSQQVRQDAGLLSLVGQLRQSGAWKFDLVGIKSAAYLGFAIATYKALTPTVYDRYSITNCQDLGNFSPAGGQYLFAPFSSFTCVPPPDIPGVSLANGQTFISLGQPASESNYPCFSAGDAAECAYDRVPGIETKPSYVLSHQIWGDPSKSPAGNCAYEPGNSQTAWHFGTCWAGVDPFASVNLNNWGFPNQNGSPDWPQAWSCATRGLAQGCDSATAAQAQSQSPIRLGRPRSGRRRAVDGRARMRTHVGTLRGMRLADATVRVNRLLFEPGHGELTAPGSRAGRRRSSCGCRASAAGASRRRPAAAVRSRSRCAGAGAGACR